MAETTNIAWADSTFNAVIGCMKVSAGCNNCYAETLMDKRYHRVKWGQRKTDDTEPSIGGRVRTSASMWRQPVIWNKHHAAFMAQHGHRQRIFCSSLADVFDNQWEIQWRTDLFDLIASTSNLDWLLLTKRPENLARMFPTGNWGNIWLGVTCEDQAAYDLRWPILWRTRAEVALRFISYEPAIGPLTLNDVGIVPDWVICGGETGPGARWMNPEWARHMRANTGLLGIPFFLKQMSKRAPIPLDLRIYEFPRTR